MTSWLFLRPPDPPFAHPSSSSVQYMPSRSLSSNSLPFMSVTSAFMVKLSIWKLSSPEIGSVTDTLSVPLTSRGLVTGSGSNPSSGCVALILRSYDPTGNSPLGFQDVCARYSSHQVFSLSFLAFSNSVRFTSSSPIFSVICCPSSLVPVIQNFTVEFSTSYFSSLSGKGVVTFPAR